VKPNTVKNNSVLQVLMGVIVCNSGSVEVLGMEIIARNAICQLLFFKGHFTSTE
jgi:hypothetical protein